ncbi:M23 family metallopeptidase [Bradyrhizobium sp. Bra78]|uniref:M23 family metallopeptidase n=1 Tax=Bradyrhizobium sp. Bra78 TaxID=2926010 RepID=UPI0021C65DBF|nr:M23 family metallopeptidase [Bradyrhizobium sp. Bra78]
MVRSATGLRLLSSLLLSVVLPASAGAIDEIELLFPVRCVLGSTCFIQSYVDHDGTDQVRDYQCGGRSYDAHDGTDIRIPDMAVQRQGVEVLATAAGTVTAIRDEIDDISVRTIGRTAIKGKECGNGVVIDHANGWKTQYCHLARGSVRVSRNERVSPGHPIGLIGLSGDTEFPHLHLTVRHRNKIVDPFAYESEPTLCGSGHSIWTGLTSDQLKYRSREILNVGFTDHSPTMDQIESGEVTKYPVSLQSEALIAYVRVIGLREGDQQTVTVRDPDGVILSEYEAPALDRNKAQYFVASGRKRKAAEWTPGSYTAAYSVAGSDGNVLRKTFEIQLGAR